jgi:hypothetical protein
MMGRARPFPQESSESCHLTTRDFATRLLIMMSYTIFRLSFVTLAPAMIQILGKVSCRNGERVLSRFMPENAGVDEEVLVVEKDGGRGGRDLQRSLSVVAATNWQTRELALAPSVC